VRAGKGECLDESHQSRDLLSLILLFSNSALEYAPFGSLNL
jgi:hypothetical protein